MSRRHGRTSRRNATPPNSSARPQSQAVDPRSSQGRAQVLMQNLQSLFQTNPSPQLLGATFHQDSHLYGRQDNSQIAVEDLQGFLQANPAPRPIGLVQSTAESITGISAFGAQPAAWQYQVPQSSQLARSSHDATPHRSLQEEEQFLNRMRGPCYCKMLVPDHVAGALIGREGAMIGEIEMISGCALQISPKKSYFPGTRDRIVLLGGSLEEVQEGIALVQQRLFETSRQKHTNILCKFAVPRSTISGLIGRGGSLIRTLSAQHNCNINISERVQECAERIVLISGEMEMVQNASMEIAKLLQGDANIKDHLTLAYSYELPLGAWEKDTQPEAEISLISPRTARNMYKQDLIEYLRKVAPRELLLRRNLLGDIKNTKKSAGLEDLVDAVSEVWSIHHGGLTEEDTYMAQILLPISESAAVLALNDPSAAEYGSPAWIMEVAQQPRPVIGSKLPFMPRERRPPVNPLPLPLPVGELEPGTALRIRRGEIKSSDLVRPENSKSIHKKTETRVLTALELLQEESESEVHFCGPPSEPDESGYWLEEEVDSYLALEREQDETQEDEHLLCDQESLGTSAEPQHQLAMNQQNSGRRLQNFNTFGMSSDLSASGVRANANPRSRRQSVAKAGWRQTSQGTRSDGRQRVSPDFDAQAAHAISQNVAGFGLFPPMPREEPMKIECVNFLHHLLQSDANCYPAWLTYASGNSDPRLHSVTSLRHFLQSYIGDDLRLRSLLGNWRLAQQPRTPARGFGWDSSGHGSASHAFPTEVATGSVQVTLPVGSQITISLQEASSSAAQPSAHSTLRHMSLPRQSLTRDSWRGEPAEGATVIKPSVSGGTGSTEDMSLDEIVLPRASQDVNVASHASPAVLGETQSTRRQSSALSHQLAHHGTPTELHPRITVGQRVLDFYAEGGQNPQQPFSQFPGAVARPVGPVGAIPTTNPSVESLEAFLSETARRGSS